MKRNIPAILIISLLLGAMLNGCGSTGSKSMTSADQNGAADDMRQEAGISSETASGESMDISDEYLMADSENPDASDIALDETTAGTNQKQGEKLIYTYHYSVETKEFDDFTADITAKTEQLGGYIENSETNGSAADGLSRYASMTLRIPADQVSQLLSLLDTESNVTYRNSSVSNISLQYVDLESHIKALRTEQETLLRLIEQAEKIKDIISLQSQLTEVRYEIESYESQLRMYDNLVDYSTVELDISEVERTTTVTPSQASFGEEVKDRFSDNLYAVAQWLRSLAIWLISSLPVLVPFVILIVIVIIIVRKLIRFLRSRTPIPTRQDHPTGYQSIYQKKNRTQADMANDNLHQDTNMTNDNLHQNTDITNDNLH